MNVPIAAEHQASIELLERLQSGGPGGGGPGRFEPGGRGGGGDDDESARKPRRQPGPSVGMLGMLAMIVSITALFATIVIAYMARSAIKSHWQPVHMPSLLWLSTGIIVVSSGTLEMARRGFRRFNASQYGRWLLATFVLGSAFLISQGMAFRELAAQGIYMRANPHSSLFYILTGTHAVHLLGGMIALGYLIWRLSLKTADLRADFRRHENTVSITALYWHFLDVLWLALVAFLMLWVS